MLRLQWKLISENVIVHLGNPPPEMDHGGQFTYQGPWEPAFFVSHCNHDLPRPTTSLHAWRGKIPKDRTGDNNTSHRTSQKYRCH